jgi:arylsulfatase A-like enzyme
MSAPYLAAIERSDRALGGLLAALDQVGVRDQYVVLFLSDHGGHDRHHGSDSPEDLTIPWILNGPGVRRGYAILRPVQITDTAATIAHLLNLPRPAEWEGQPVLEALDA